MRFEILSTDGVQRTVELSLPSVIAGRDPACDLVLDDSRCSRRHAIFEIGPQGLSVRDNGSANGVFVNGRKVERSGLVVGDIVRLGESVLRVLGEAEAEAPPPPEAPLGQEEVLDIEETEPLGRPSDLGLPDPAAHHPPAPPPPAHAPGVQPPRPPAAPPPGAKRPTGPASHPPRPQPAPGPPHVPGSLATSPPGSLGARPLTVSVLAMLWLITGLIVGGAGVGAALLGPWTGMSVALIGGGGLLQLVLGALMSYGLWALAPWARVLQMTLAGLGLVSCALTLPSVVVLAYLLRPETREAFGGPPAGRRLDRSAETAFTLGLLASLVLSLALAASLYWLGPLRFGRGAPSAEVEQRVVSRLQRLQLAQQQFRSGVCHNAYGDLPSLLRPAAAVPGYPADGPAFLPPEFEAEREAGYRFTLEVSDMVSPTQGCPAQGFRHYEYRATPEEVAGRHYAVSGNGSVRFADGRPARDLDASLP